MESISPIVYKLDKIIPVDKGLSKFDINKYRPTSIFVP